MKKVEKPLIYFTISVVLYYDYLILCFADRRVTRGYMRKTWAASLKSKSCSYQLRLIRFAGEHRAFCRNSCIQKSDWILARNSILKGYWETFLPPRGIPRPLKNQDLTKTFFWTICCFRSTFFQSKLQETTSENIGYCFHLLERWHCVYIILQVVPTMHTLTGISRVGKKFSCGECLVQGHVVAICICCALFVTSQFDSFPCFQTNV